MNKTELIAEIAKKTDLSKRDAEAALLATIETITENLKSGEKVSLVGFGVFEARARSARKVLNPRTKKESMIEAFRAPAFRPSKSLKELVR